MFVTGLLSCPLSNDFISKPQSQNPQGNLLGSLPTGADLSPSVVTWEVSLSLDHQGPLSSLPPSQLLVAWSSWTAEVEWRVRWRHLGDCDRNNGSYVNIVENLSLS